MRIPAAENCAEVFSFLLPNQKLRRDNERLTDRLTDRLRKAEIVIDVQKLGSLEEIVGAIGFGQLAK